MEAIILAGGFGTRLTGLVRDVPKPMAPVAGRPFLEYILDDLVKQGIDRAVLAVGYKKEIIMDHFQQRYRGLELLYSAETEPLLTGGAIRQAMALCREERVFVINGDTFFQVDLSALRTFALRSGKAIVITLKEMKNISRYGAVEIDRDGNVTAIREKEALPWGYINGGIYDMSRHALERFPERFSLENDGFPDMFRKGQLKGFLAKGFFIDIGVPEDYMRAQTILGSEEFA